MVKIRRGIFQGDSFSPLQFVIGLIPLSLLLRGTHTGYKFSSDGPEVNHRLYMDDLKLYGKSEGELETLLNTTQTFSDDICIDLHLKKVPHNLSRPEVLRPDLDNMIQLKCFWLG